MPANAEYFHTMNGDDDSYPNVSNSAIPPHIEAAEETQNLAPTSILDNGYVSSVVQNGELNGEVQNGELNGEVQNGELNGEVQNGEESEDTCSAASSSTASTMVVEIPCLLPENELEVLCRVEGLSYNSCKDIDTDEYEVDLILDDSNEKGEQWYLVKWKNYSMSDATWEPVKNLTSCGDLLKQYHVKKSSRPILGANTRLTQDMFKKYIRKITRKKELDIASLMKLYVLHKREKCAIFHPIDQPSVKLKLRDAVLEMENYGVKRLCKLKLDIFEIMQFTKAREDALQKLKEWEQKINEANIGPYIQVANDIDGEGPPVEFKFVSEYIFVGIPMRNDPLLGCECVQCDETSNCCGKLAHESFAYDKNGCLKLSPGYPIYECNIRCKCGPTCMNRVVQKGRKVKLEIFRTHNGRGWGLRTKERIKRGKFVVEYIGEIITTEGAEQRRYDDGDSYLFDLDFDCNECVYTVDAKNYGNSAHFINHSCDPNLHVSAVWVNHLDPHLPRLAFFARRDIRWNEELTFDYRMNKDAASHRTSQSLPSTPKKGPQNPSGEGSSSTGEGSSSTHQEFSSVAECHDASENQTESSVKRIPCRCGSKICRGYLF